MLYCNKFENLTYKFGDEVDTVIFQNLSIYVDIIDEIKNNITFLNVHTIQEGFRPDQVSIQLYGTPLYHWSFYLLNDDIREQGWPLTRHELEVYTKKIFPNTTITTRDADLANKFKVGQTVTGGTTSLSGKIIKRNIDKFFVLKVYKKDQRYLLIKNTKFNFLKNLRIFPMEEVSKPKNFNRNLNFKMSNMNMNIKIQYFRNNKKLPFSYWMDQKKIENYMLPTFTKKIVKYLEGN